MPKGTLSIDIKCANCGGTVFQFSDDLSASSLVHCTNCGGNVGPYGALKAAMRGEAHAAIGAHADFTVSPLKPIE
jgi:ribosomal protein S27E